MKDLLIYALGSMLAADMIMAFYIVMFAAFGSWG